MKKLALYIILVFSCNITLGQYYLRGEVTDEKSRGLQNAKIFLHSAKSIYYSGNKGSFGITVINVYDSITVSLEGYESRTIRVKTDMWQTIVLKVNIADANKNKPKLISITKDHQRESRFKWFIGDETYFQLIENDYVNTSKFPATGFSLNVNKSSYSNIRRFLNMNSTVPPDAVRAEEIINYFNLNYRHPVKDEIFSINSQLTECPWQPSEQLLYVGVSAKMLDLSKAPPSNFVFLIDASGSMDHEKKLTLLKAAFQLFIKNLRPIDTVSIVIYGGTVAVWLQPTSGSEKEKISKSIEELTAQGDTPGESAIRAAYQIARSTFIEGGNNRVILATDGDFNVGESSERALEELIVNQRQTGVYLTCLGVGMGNFKDSKLQTLAKKGNGNYAYLDDIHEAEKVLVTELSQTIYSVADDATLNIVFNPSMVKSYRLVGFDNKREAMMDSTSILEGGEVGSGNSTLAVFQIEPTEQNLLTRGMKIADDLATIEIIYGNGKDSSWFKMKAPVPDNFMKLDSISKDLRLATALTMFALKLKQSKYIGGATWEQITRLAATSADPANFLQQEFLLLIEKAKKIYEPKKKKKKRSDD